MPEYQGRLSGVVSLPRDSCLHQLRPPLLGVVGFAPGFVEGHKLLQRVDGVGVLGAELALAPVEGVEELGLAIEKFVTVLYSIGHWRMRPNAAGLPTQLVKARRGHVAEAAVRPVVSVIHACGCGETLRSYSPRNCPAR